MEQASISYGLIAVDAVTTAKRASKKHKVTDQYARNVAKLRLLHGPYKNNDGIQKSAVESNFEVYGNTV